jgi:hypothetical protein
LGWGGWGVLRPRPGEALKWPLVSRRAFDLALDERDRLRAQVDSLLDIIASHQDHLRRVQRLDMGVREVPQAGPAPGRQSEIPRELMEYALSVGNPAMREELIRDWRVSAKTVGWEEVRQKVMGGRQIFGEDDGE